MANVDWDPAAYLELMLADIPAYVELQERVAAATEDLDVHAALELGIGTGETARRVLALHPQAKWTAIDANEAMLNRAREVPPDADLRRARLEDPLPEGLFDLVVSSLVVHHLEWLRDAGFDAEALWTYKDLAIVRARRPRRSG